MFTEFIAAYNLLLHLIRQSDKMNMFLPRVCQNLSNPITSSPANGPGLALSIFSTIFNLLAPDDDARYHVFFAILRVIRASGTFEALRPQLENLDSWLTQWDMDEEEQRKLFLAIVDVANDAGEGREAYEYLIRALRRTQDEPASPEARQLAVRALKTALMQPNHFDFQDLIGLDCIQQLRRSDPVHFELLEIFNADVLDDFVEFQASRPQWLAGNGLDEAVLTKKMRLLTLASLGASAGATRELSYAKIAAGLRVPEEEVEDWIIDGVRANLVEGRMAQLDKRFLIQRATYRVFGENQWREVESRLAHWRSSLTSVLAVIQSEKERVAAQQEADAREVDSKVNAWSEAGGNQRRQQQEQY